jgi:hypothetical protein
MAGFGSLIWILAIGALVFFMIRKGGWCCGSDHEHEHDHQANKDRPRGGCCG